MKLQCKACSKRCVRNYEDQSCPDGKTAEFRKMRLKYRPGIYNAQVVRI